MNLSELAQVIKADRNLSRRVIKAAIRECGWPALTVEQAIVLLGRERLALQFLRIPSRNPIAQAATSCPSGPLHPSTPTTGAPGTPFQEELE